MARISFYRLYLARKRTTELMSAAPEVLVSAVLSLTGGCSLSKKALTTTHPRVE